MTRRFYTLDVFTDKPLAGNPLAVVLDSEGLDDIAMLKIAGEFNLSETVFVSPPTDPENRASIRIFTPAHELPFAGHPTVGTAILLNQLSHLGQGDNLVLEEKVGPVRCQISIDKGVSTARFGLPKVATNIENEFDVELLAEALGLKVDDIDGSNVQVWDGGVGYTMVPVHSMEAVKAVEVTPSLLPEALPFCEFRVTNPYVFCKGGEGKDADFHARMFAPNFGIPEDPATGSAVSSLSGWIAEHEMLENEERLFKIEQGYEMGRPSQIYLDIAKRDGLVTTAGISGSAVVVSEGKLRL